MGKVKKLLQKLQFFASDFGQMAPNEKSLDESCSSLMKVIVQQLLTDIAMNRVLTAGDGECCVQVLETESYGVEMYMAGPPPSPP